MKIYEVYRPATENSDREENSVFISDKFMWRAFFFAPFWLLWHRLWVQGVSFLAGLLILTLMVHWFPVLDVSAWVLVVLSAFMVGLEGNDWRTKMLERQGFQPVDLIYASNKNDAEDIFFARLHRNSPADKSLG